MGPGTATPGAARSTLAPVLLKPAALPWESVAPTVSRLAGADAMPPGVWPAASAPQLPAEAMKSTFGCAAIARRSACVTLAKVAASRAGGAPASAHATPSWVQPSGSTISWAPPISSALNAPGSCP